MARRSGRVGPKGVEPLPVRLKGGCAAVTPRPRMLESGVCVSVEMDVALLLLLVPRSQFQGSPGWSRTNRRRHIRSPCFRYNTGPQSGRSESNPLARAPKARGPPLPYIPLFLRSPSSSSYGSRTHLSGLKGQYPAPIDERAVCSVMRMPSAVGREALESSSPGLQPGAKPSQLPTRDSRPAISTKKGPVSLGHRAFKLFAYLGLAERHKRNGNRRLSAASAE